MGDDRITPHDADELARCFRAPIAMLRWQLDMKEAEIAALLGVAEKTVSAQLHRARRKLIMQLGADHPFTRGDGEGASP